MQADYSFNLIQFGLVVLVAMVLGIKSNITFRKTYIYSTFLLWFLVGGLQIYFQQGNFSPSYFMNQYRNGNQLIVNTNEVSETSSKHFSKSVATVQAVVSVNDTTKATGKVLLFFENGDQKVKRNEIIICKPLLNKIVNKNNIGEFDAAKYWNNQAIQEMAFVPSDRYQILTKNGFSVTDFLLSCRDNLSKIIDHFLSGQEAAVAKGLILGDRSTIASETTRMFGNTGVMHILAVSGMHVAILVLILNYFLQLFPKYISKRTAAYISLLIVWTYSLMTGFSPSVSRAAWMFTFIVGGTLLNRDVRSINGLLISALIILIWNPLSLFDIGFQLSYAAMIGIYTFFPFLRKQLYFKQKWIQTTWDGTALGIAAQLFTTPIALFYFHQFPNYFWLTNIALSAYSTIILGLGILLFISSVWSLSAKMIGFLLFWVMFSMLWIIQFIDRLPYSVSEGFVLSAWLVIFLYVLVSMFYTALAFKKMWVLIPTLSISLIIVSAITYQRFRNATQSRWVVFNDKSPIIILKDKSHSFVLFAKTNEKSKQINQLVSSFQRIYPSQQIDTIQLEKNHLVELQTSKYYLSSLLLEDGWHFNIVGRRFFIPQKEDYISQNDEAIVLPPTMNDETVFYQLNQGALNITLE